MKSLKLFAVAAVFGAVFMSCEAESLNDDQVQVEEVDVFSSTENGEVQTSNDSDDD